MFIVLIQHMVHLAPLHVEVVSPHEFCDMNKLIELCLLYTVQNMSASRFAMKLNVLYNKSMYEREYVYFLLLHQIY